MAELITPQQKIRELNTPARRIPIEIDGAISYEVVLTMWNLVSSKKYTNSFDLGTKWFTEVQDATPEDLKEEIVRFGGSNCTIWLSLLGLISVAPHPHDPDSVFNWIGELNPQRLRRWILGYLGEQAALETNQGPPAPSLIEQAALGDIDSVREIIGSSMDPDGIDQVVAMFEMDPIEMRDRMATALRRFRSEVFSKYEDEFGKAIAAAAAARRSVATRDSAKDVIEAVTNGLDYEIPLGVSRVILVPSMIVRPLSLIDQHRDTLIVCYGLADEFINLNPEAPPSWMVRFYKALSDEKRLRILRRLSEGDTSLDELTELLDLSKSTVHHHITILRGAGLVRVSIGSTKAESKYGLRPQAIEDASASLEGYMRPQDKSALA
ncbi:MAG TPA: ArsR family transcriptional regulator [Acidimicrobiia bacterium]|nr:ArsR family transcriptional regulator [Acidimicrobiia bacterium]